MSEDADFRPPMNGYEHPCAWQQDFPPLSMNDMMANSVAAHRDKPICDFYGRTMTYGEVMDEAKKFAAGLQASGIAKGDRVGLFLPNVPMYLSAYFGILLTGAVVVNFSPLYTAEELKTQVADSGTRLLVTLDSSALLPTAIAVLRESSLERLIVGHLADMLPFTMSLGLRLFRRKEITAMPVEVAIINWQDALLDAEPAPAAIDPLRDLALLQYTGGTTGTPKGAMLSHQNLTANCRQNYQINPHKDERDVIVGVLPMFHVFANSTVLNRTVYVGGCIVMLPRFDAGQCLKAIARTRATSLPGVPTMYQALLDHPDCAKTDFSSLQVCISGGAPLPPQVQQRFQEITGANLVEGYGLTESASAATVNPLDGSGKIGTIGQPLPGTELRLLDKEDPSRAAPAGEPGELAIKGPQVMLGYWNKPEANADVFVGGWLRTGDVAMIADDGYVRIVDRIKDMIAVAGFKVFPSQVEAVLRENPAVKEVLVIGVPDAYRGEAPRAFAVLQPDSIESGESLKDWLNKRLGKHERVDAVVLRDSLPKTMVGKLDRKALRAEIAEAG
jgi:long-chain acyl-CoA synthetase